MGQETISQTRILKRRWNGIPIRDADAALLIFISEDDVKNAVPGDPANCAASLACKRLYRSTGVEFFHSVAYVDLPDSQSDNQTDRVVLRFILDKRTRRMIEELDGGGSPSPGGYKLRQPAKGETLDAQATRQQTFNNRRREARISGEIYESTIQRPQSKPNTRRLPGMAGYVRSGTGRVQMKRFQSE